MSNPERFATAASSARRDATASTREGATTGAELFRDAKAGIADAVTEIGKKGREAAQDVRDVRDTLAKAVLHVIKSHPYATLAVAGGIGFVVGAAWRR